MKAPLLPLVSRIDLKPSLTSLAALAILLGAGVHSSHAQATTGFNQAGAGPFDYNSTENWVNGTINGVWDPSLTLTAGQTVTFGADTLLSSGLNIGYTGNVDLTFRADGFGDYTLTLGNDLNIAPISNRSVTIGSITTGQGLNVNLGGSSKVFNVAGAKTLTFLNSITNGDFSVTGGGTVRLARATGVATNSSIEVNSNSALMLDSSNGGVVGATRAQQVTLKSGGKLLVNGNGSVNSVDAITGNLVIDGSAPRARASTNSISNVTLTPGNTKNATLTLGGLTRVASGVVLFRGNNLGSNPASSAAPTSSNLMISGAVPALVGGNGDAGTTNVSIIPWALGGSTVADAGSTFVTYSAANGIRPLDVTTEFAPAFGSATDNVRLVAPATVDTSATANSLIIAPGAPLSGAGTVNVTSGAVFFSRTTGTATPISTGLNFGTAEGIIGYTRGETISGPVAGSKGLTIYGLRTDENLQLTSPDSTYTGDTTILANAQVSTGFLPFGSRTGDVYVYGNLQLNVAGYNGTINGLFGNGAVTYGNSSVSTIRIGDNNATSTFTGTIAGNTNLNVTKIGSGTLTLTGANTNARVTTVQEGTLAVTTLADGGTASGIGSSTSVAGNLVIAGGTLKYIGAATSTDRLFQVGQAGAGAIGTLDSSGTGAVNFTNSGALAYGTAGATNNVQTRTLVLSGSNTGDNTLSAAIGNNGAATNGNSAVSLTKSGPGKWILAGADTYTGVTTVDAGTLVVAGSISGTAAVNVNNGGTLLLNGSDRINDAAALILNGGTFKTGGFSEGTSSSPGLGALTLSANSVIDFGSGTGSSLLFAGVGTRTAGAVLAITNWSGTTSQAGGLNDDRLLFAGTTADFKALFPNQADVSFNGIAGYSAIQVDAGHYEIAAVPEPSTLSLALAAVGIAGWRRRRPATRTA